MKINKEFLKDLVADVVGSVLLSVGIFSFAEKVNIAPGGTSGIAIMIKYLTGFPVGIMSFLINIPLLVIAYKFMGKSFVARTVRTLIINTLFLDLVVTPFFPQYGGDRMLGAVFGGVATGLGLGIIFLRGSTTAGTDIISFIVEKKYPHIKVGKAMMFVDGVILAFSALVFKNIESALFGVVAIFCQSKIIDGIVYGAQRGHQIMVISEKSEKIAERIVNERERGATFLLGEGAYSKKGTKVLMCVVRDWEYIFIKEIIYEEDANAFIIVSQADKIMGEGFSQR